VYSPDFSRPSSASRARGMGSDHQFVMRFNRLREWILPETLVYHAGDNATQQNT